MSRQVEDERDLGAIHRANRKVDVFPKTIEVLDAHADTAQRIPEKRQGDRPEPQNKRLRANLTREVNGRTLNAKDATFGWLRHEADQSNPRGKKTVVCIMDGEAKLWARQREMFTKAVGVLDIFHVMEHLWPCVHRFESENTPKACRLFEKQLRAILEVASAA